MNDNKTLIKSIFIICAIPVLFMDCSTQAQVSNDSSVDYETSGITEDSDLPVFYEKLSQRLNLVIAKRRRQIGPQTLGRETHVQHSGARPSLYMAG